MASSALIELDGDGEKLRLVFDFGRGVAARLTELGLRQDEVEHVVLSHFHPDHLSDLVPYLHAGAWSRIDPRRRDLHIYGPIGLEVQLMRLLSLFGPDNLVREHYRVRLHEIRGDRLTIAGRDLDFCDLPPADNHGLRFAVGDKTYALTGDSSYHPQEIEFLRGCELAVIDAGHLDDDEILSLAVSTQVPVMVCSHLYRELDAEDLGRRGRARGYTGRFVVGRDLMAFEL